MFTKEFLQNSVILDTETTGLDDEAQVVELSIIDAFSGDVLFNSLVKPTMSIPQDAIDIHGITNDLVKNAPNFSDVYSEVFDLIYPKNLLVYNASFDSRLIIQTMQAHGHYYELRDHIVAFSRYFYGGNMHCIMEAYAEHYGQWNDYQNAYKWQSLTNACKQQAIDISDLNAHRALADCEMTRRLIHRVWLGA